MKRKRIKIDDEVTVIKNLDYYYGYTGLIVDRMLSNGMNMWRVKFKIGRSAWYTTRELKLR